jgi:hypothetical protein
MIEVDTGHMSHSLSENSRNENEFLVNNICRLEIKIYETTTRDFAYLGLSLILEITNLLQSVLPDFIFTDMILIIFNK